MPRVGGAIVGLAGAGPVTVLQLATNRLAVVDRVTERVRGVAGGLTRNSAGWPAATHHGQEMAAACQMQPAGCVPT